MISQAYASVCLAPYPMEFDRDFYGPGSFVSLGLFIYLFIFPILHALKFIFHETMLNLSVGGSKE